MKQWTQKRFNRYYSLIEEMCCGDQQSAVLLARQARSRWFDGKTRMNRTERNYCCNALVVALLEVYAKYGAAYRLAWRSFCNRLYWVGKYWEIVAIGQQRAVELQEVAA